MSKIKKGDWAYIPTINKVGKVSHVGDTEVKVRVDTTPPNVNVSAYGNPVDVITVAIDVIILISQLLPLIERLILQIRAMFGSQKAAARLKLDTEARDAFKSAGAL